MTEEKQQEQEKEVKETPQAESPQAEAPKEEAPKAEQVKGKVKWFSNVKGYGFLEKEGSEQDIFVHYSSIQGEGYKTLRDAEEVTFQITQGEKGPQAVNVIRSKSEKKG